MINPFENTLSHFLGEGNYALVLISGYVIFTILFYSYEDKSIWRNCQWGDRAFIAVIFGVMLYVAYTIPINVLLSTWILFIPNNESFYFSPFSFNNNVLVNILLVV